MLPPRGWRQPPDPRRGGPQAALSTIRPVCGTRPPIPPRPARSGTTGRAGRPTPGNAHAGGQACAIPRPGRGPVIAAPGRFLTRVGIPTDVKVGIVVFPGSNCDRDVHHVLMDAGMTPSYIWHEDPVPDDTGALVLPGGFSYGDRLRAGAIASHSPVMGEVRRMAARGQAHPGHMQRVPGTGRGRHAAGRPAGERRLQVHLQVDHAGGGGRLPEDALHQAHHPRGYNPRTRGQRRGEVLCGRQDHLGDGEQRPGAVQVRRGYQRVGRQHSRRPATRRATWSG